MNQISKSLDDRRVKSALVRYRDETLGDLLKFSINDRNTELERVRVYK